MSPPNSTALSIQTGNGWPPVLVRWNASQSGSNSNQNISKKQVPMACLKQTRLWCHKKIPTDHWNIPQTLNHMFEYGNPSIFLFWATGYVPRGLLEEAHGSAQMESHGLNLSDALRSSWWRSLNLCLAVFRWLEVPANLPPDQSNLLYIGGMPQHTRNNRIQDLVANTFECGIYIVNVFFFALFQ